jgi:hypothetical protein
VSYPATTLNQSVTSGQSFVLQGPAVISSDITVEADVASNGVNTHLTGKGSFAVTARSWPSYQLGGPVRVSQGNLPYVPTRFSDLARTTLDNSAPYQQVVDATSLVRTGPNAGFYYAVHPFAPATLQVVINDRALNSSSWWWRHQHEGFVMTSMFMGVPLCDWRGGQYSMPLQQIVSELEDHEGLTSRGATSHVQVWQSYFASHDVNSAAEALVARAPATPDVLAFSDATKKMFTDVLAAAQAAQDQVDTSPNNPYQPTCMLQFPTPPTSGDVP